MLVGSSAYIEEYYVVIDSGRQSSEYSCAEREKKKREKKVPKWLNLNKANQSTSEANKRW